MQGKSRRQKTMNVLGNRNQATYRINAFGRGCQGEVRRSTWETPRRVRKGQQ